MIILEKPLVSQELKAYLQASKTPVLDNAYAREILAGTPGCRLTGDAEARERIAGGERLYTVSENALEWVLQNIDDPCSRRVIDTMKNKTAMRQILQSAYPDFFFREISVEKLAELDFDTIPVPVVLKPSVGFFSVGVYTVRDKNDWQNALDDIQKSSGNWKKLYPESVLAKQNFILEKYIDGDEYAVDVYFDGDGNAVILNILKHDFSSASDVSDRLYYTSKKVILENLEPFTAFFNRVNKSLGARNFPAHVELRVEDGKAVPVEFNPMRFSGYCTTDVSLFAYGFRTYDFYLNDKKPDWEKILSGKDGKIYAMILLNKPVPCPEVKDFDYDSLCKKFQKILCLRKSDWQKNSVFGFLFVETDNPQELDYIVKSDLLEFCKI
ncbi:MAG: ATP-grasp domain-containing protein [Opitutales bacterium]|nr:ATP-grasp domain-containing protein [Opitutales bacterium]